MSNLGSGSAHPHPSLLGQPQVRLPPRSLLLLDTPLPEVLCVPKTHARSLAPQKDHNVLPVLVDEARSQTRPSGISEASLDANVGIRMLPHKFVSIVPLRNHHSSAL